MIPSSFPQRRMRRYRKGESIRELFREVDSFKCRQMILPLFIQEGSGVKEAIPSFYGQYRWSVDRVIEFLQPLVEKGLGGVLLFPVPGKKNEPNRGELENSFLLEAISTIKEAFPELVLWTDVCLCAYKDHGHCGQLDQHGEVDNDSTLEALSHLALAHVQAGADGVAPSAMMDGQVRSIRRVLDQNAYEDKLIMSYAVKFASSLYGPFREAASSSPSQGNRRGYQLDMHNPRQALMEALLDEGEGADVLMVKPGLFYLDILAQLREKTNLPLALYQVSGEYSMIYEYGKNDRELLLALVQESLIAGRRGGADVMISYWPSLYREYPELF